ncbi:TIGR02391 family protein [Patescibacteria group bacterium]|nr:TIGR02391 family protein [Patescibacteria group bacterium]
MYVPNIDKLTIKRDALLEKKRFLDAIDKLKQRAPEGKKELKTDCYFLTDSVGVHEWMPFTTLVETINSEKQIQISVQGRSGGSPWGENLVIIQINDDFDDYVERIRKEFHDINNQIGREKPNQSLNTEDTNTLHPDIISKCEVLYSKGLFAEAVEKSFKVVRDKLRQITGYETGSDAFGKTNIHIVGAAAENVDKDFNEGVKFLCMSIDKFRNEKSHTSDGDIDDLVRAYEYLRLSSLALHLLDSAEND